MPLQYYDPMLYASTSANPNVMSVTVTLTEPVEGELLREAVEQCRVRFPYFYIRPRVEGNELIPVPNPLPVIVRGTWAPTLLCSRETNYHLMAFKYEGNRLAVEMVHSISDGAGLLPYLKSVLYVYLSQKCQTQYDPTGFRLPGQAIPDTEIGDPFPGIDVDSVEAPFYQKPPVADFYQLSNRHPVGRDHWQVYFLKLPEDQVIRYCRDNDGSPNVLISALLARAIRQADPDDERTITAGVAIDHKAMLGNSDKYRLFANIASVDFPKERSGDDILKASAGLLILAFAIKALMKAVEELTKFDYEGNKTGIIALIGICALFAGFTKILGNGGKNAIQAAASLLIMSVAIRMLIGPIKEITEFATSLEGDALGKARDAVANLGLFILALAGAMKLAGSGAIGSGAGFVMMAAAVSIIADAMAKLTDISAINTDGLITSFEGIGVLMVVFGAMAKSVKPTELLAAGAAMVILSASISIIADAMAKTTAISIASPDGLIASFMGIAALMTIMGGIATTAKPTELLAASAAMIALSASIAIIAVAISSLASVDSGSLTAAGNAMVGVLGVVGLMAVVLSMPGLSVGAVTVLPMLSLALISLGAACLLIGIGLEHATTGIVNLALALPLLQEFTATIASNVGNFMLAAAGLGALGLAFAVFGPTALVAGAGIWFLANGIRDMLMLIIQLPELIPMAGESLASLFDIIVEKAEGLVGNLGEWWSSSVWPFLTSAFEQAKSWFVSTAIPMIGEWLGKFLGKAKEFISNLHKWWASNGPGILSKVREFITTFISKIGEVVPKLATWVSSKGIPAAVKAVKDIVNKAKDTLGPKISEFVKTIPSKLSSAINGIGSSIAATGRNIAEGLARGISSVPQALTHALQSLCSNALGYVKRFFGIKSPSRVMRDEVGRYIPEGMAVGILKFSDVLIDASKELTKTTVDAMNDGLNHANYAAFSPSIAPVVDMNGFNSDILAYNRALNNSMMNGSLHLNTGVNGEMSLSADLASRLDSDMDKAGTIASVIQDSLNTNMAITEELVNKTNYILEALNGDTTNIRDALASGMNVYFDKTALIGAIAPEVDSALGRRTILAGRGVY